MTIAATSPLSVPLEKLAIMVGLAGAFQDQIGGDPTPAQVQERIHIPFHHVTGLDSFLAVARPYVVIQYPEDGHGWNRIDGGQHAFHTLELIFVDNDRHPNVPRDSLIDFANWTGNVAKHLAEIADTQEHLRMESLIQTTPPERPGLDQQAKGPVWLSAWTFEIPFSS